MLNFSDGTPPAHPGEFLKDDLLPRYGLSRKELAAHLGLSTYLVGQFLNGKRPVTCDLAMRLGKAFGHGARFWLGMQMQYDLWLTEQDAGPAVERLTRRGRVVPQGTRIGFQIGADGVAVA